MRSHSSYVLFGSAAVALIAISPAQAQSAPTREADSDSGAIVVTAQRRSERLEQVPISITAKSGAELEQAGVANFRDLQIVTPGLRQGSTQQAIATIRGVTTRQTDPGNDPNVAFYIDGVYQSNNQVNNADLPDVERIEVLKGPQGTLFGRNATGGAIRVFTRAPSFEPGGSVDLSYGNYNRFSAKAFVTGPVVADKVAVSVSGYFERHDGYYFNIASGAKARPSDREGGRPRSCCSRAKT